MKKILVYFVPLSGILSCGQESTKKESFLDADGVPIPTHLYVNDFTQKMLNATELQKLEKKLHRYEDSTSTQIVIMCVPHLSKNKNGVQWVLENLSLKTARTWAIGQKEKNNGILIFIAKDEQRVRIETGYGAEGALPDITCKKIIYRDITPYFKENKYYEGLEKCTTSIFQALAGEYEAVVKKEEAEKTAHTMLLVGVGVCVIIGLFSLWAGSLIGGTYIGFFWYFEYASGPVLGVCVGFVGAVIVLILSLITRAILTGSSGDVISSSGSSGFSGASGSFLSGGGGFGGGGASGSW